MSIRAIELISVPVSDQDASKRFYVDLLGFEVMRDDPFREGARWIQLAPPRGETSITLVTWFDSAPPGSMQGAVLCSDALEADYDRLAADGVAFSAPIQLAPWGRFATFADPDGNGWVLREAVQDLASHRAHAAPCRATRP